MTLSNGTGLFYLFCYIATCGFVFAVMRQVLLWYWKINKLESYQLRLIELGEKQLVATEKTNSILQQLSNPRTPASYAPPQPQFPPTRRAP